MEEKTLESQQPIATEVDIPPPAATAQDIIKPLDEAAQDFDFWEDLKESLPPWINEVVGFAMIVFGILSFVSLYIASDALVAVTWADMLISLFGDGSILIAATIFALGLVLWLPKAGIRVQLSSPCGCWRWKSSFSAFWRSCTCCRATAMGGGLRVPLAGVPVRSVEQHLARLVAKGHRVAICEQLEQPSATRGLVKRGVVRVVSPGTALEPALLEAGEASACAAVSLDHSRRGLRLGLAAADITTGACHVAELEGAA